MTGNSDVSRLDQLAFELEKAKEAEKQARNQRIEIEQQICEQVGVKKEGTHSQQGQYYKVTTSAGFTRTLDPTKWEEVKSNLPQSVAESLVRTKTELNTSQFKTLQEIDPATYAIAAEAVTTKPKKVAVSFKRIEGDK